MTSFHDLQARRRELLNELDEIEEALAEVAGLLEGVTEPIPEELMEPYRHRGWLQRQQMGLWVVLHDTERALLAFDAVDWEAT
jgi:hypothetical protein